MDIVIVGCGKIGYTLAQLLTKDGHNITIIDKEPKMLLKADNTLDVMCVKGNGANVRTLLEAGIDHTEVIIAVTGNDELNMVCCLAAKQLGAQFSIARIRDPENTDSLQTLQNKLDIDFVINPERTTALEISRLLRFPFALSIESFAHGRVEMVEFLAEASDPIIGVPLVKLHGKHPKVQISAVLRAGQAIIPNGDFRIEAGDRVTANGDRNSITAFFKDMGKSTERLRSAMVIGGGHIAYYFARSIAGMGVKLKLIEIDEKRCAMLTEMVDDNVMVINADGTDRETLEDANVNECGALICLTNRDEENLITGMYGAKNGAKKVIVKVNRLNPTEVMENLGVQSVVSPKISTANAILRVVRAKHNSKDSTIEKVYSMLDGSVEAIEFTAREGAKYLNIPLSSLHIRKNVLVAIIVRDRKNIIPFGADHIEAGDTVLLTAKSGEIMNLEDAFRLEETHR